MLETTYPAANIHIICAMLGFCLIFLSGALAILMYLQDRWLKHAHPWLCYLPSLEKLDHILFVVISLGFGFLTLGLLTGFIFLEEQHQAALSIKFLLSLLAWSVFAILLWGRYQFGWRGQRAVQLTLLGMIILMSAYLMMRFF